MKFSELEGLVAAGESETVEFKKSTALLARAGETLCGFLNAQGGLVLIGVTDGQRIVGQDISAKTQQEIATMIARFEPPPPIHMEMVEIPGAHKRVVLLKAMPSGEVFPFTYDGRPYRRLGTSTSLMPQEQYQQLLLDRMHSRRRWENLPAEKIDMEDLDQSAIQQTVRAGQSVGRLPESVGLDVDDILDRLGLRSEGIVLNAAVVLFGKRFLPTIPSARYGWRASKELKKLNFSTIVKFTAMVSSFWMKLCSSSSGIYL